MGEDVQKVAEYFFLAGDLEVIRAAVGLPPPVEYESYCHSHPPMHFDSYWFEIARPPCVYIRCPATPALLTAADPLPLGHLS